MLRLLPHTMYTLGRRTPEGSARGADGTASSPRFAAVAAAVSAVSAIVVLIGWILDVRPIRDLFGWSNAMAPTTAFSFVCCSVALWLVRRPPVSPARRAATVVLSLIAMVPAVIKLGEHVLALPLSMDITFSVQDAGEFPGEMAIPTAVAFLFLAPAIAMLDVETRRGWRPAQALALLGLTLPLLGLVGRLYGVPAVQQFVGGTVIMALHTAMLFFLLFAGVMRSRLDQGLTRMFVDGGRAGTLLRYLIPSMAVGVIAVGWLRVVGQRAGWYGTELGSTAFVVFTVVIVTALIILTAKRLYRTEIERREGEDRERSVLASLGDGVAITDVSGKLISINPALQRLAGWDENEAVGRPYAEVFELLDDMGAPIPAGERFLERALMTHEVVRSQGHAASLRCRDGRLLPVSVTASPILDAEGRVIGGVEVIRDVSYQREVDQLKSSLISTVSHELRTPLTMIQGFSEILLSRVNGDEQTQYALRQINHSSERLSRLVTDLLSVSRIEAGRLDVNFEAIPLEAAVRLASEQFASQRQVRLEVDDEATTALADSDKLHQVLTNLISNAIKYSPPESPVEVAVRPAGSEKVEICVRDQGIGMTNEELDGLFEKFFRADREEVRTTPGTGLGLYITKKLIELQGGTIRASSSPGRGTEMTVTLPKARPLEESPALDVQGNDTLRTIRRTG